MEKKKVDILSELLVCLKLKREKVITAASYWGSTDIIWPHLWGAFLMRVGSINA